MKALIDTDIIIYEAASICEASVPWPYGDAGEVLWTRHAHIDEAWARLWDSIETLRDKAGADEAVLCVTDTTNFRSEFYGEYKSHRKPSVKPLLVPVLRERIAQHPQGMQRPGLEGDDIMGILATRPKAGDVVMVTIDKDLKTIPGRHFQFRSGNSFEVTEAEANQYFLQQTLSGDATDGYPGCRGLGPKKAYNLVPDPVPTKDVPAVWRDVVVPAYEKAGFDETFALSQARCARILRASDYDPENKKVIPWTPY